MGGAAEGLEQRVAAPGSAFRLRSLSSTRVLDTTGLRGPGSQAGLLAARSRPGGCWPGAPLPGLAFAAFLTSVRSPVWPVSGPHDTTRGERGSANGSGSIF